MCARPSTTNSTMALTLITASQYSVRPKWFTAWALTVTTTAAKPSDQSQTGAAGNQ